MPPRTPTAIFKDEIYLPNYSGITPAIDIFDRISSWQWGYYSASTGTTSTDSMGMLNTMTHTDSSSSESEDADGHFFKQNTGTAQGNDAEISLSNFPIRLENLPHLVIKFKLVQTEDTRFFAGIGTTSSVDNDTPTNAVMLRFSSDTDTNFTWFENDGSTSKTTDTGIPADTNAHFVELEATSSTSVKATLYDSTFTLQNTAILNTNLPSATTSRSFYVGIETRTTAAKSINQYYGFLALKVGER